MYKAYDTYVEDEDGTVGIEREPGYVQVAQERIASALPLYSTGGGRAWLSCPNCPSRRSG